MKWLAKNRDAVVFNPTQQEIEAMGVKNFKIFDLRKYVQCMKDHVASKAINLEV
jgi:hypothetical protein